MNRSALLGNELEKFSASRVSTDRNVNELDIRLTELQENQETHESQAEIMLGGILENVDIANGREEELRNFADNIPTRIQKEEGEWRRGVASDEFHA